MLYKACLSIVIYCVYVSICRCVYLCCMYRRKVNIHCSPLLPGGDQGLLNLYWSDWATKDIKHHLPFIYNMVPNAAYGYAPAFQRFEDFFSPLLCFSPFL